MVYSLTFNILLPIVFVRDKFSVFFREKFYLGFIYLDNNIGALAFKCPSA